MGTHVHLGASLHSLSRLLRMRLQEGQEKYDLDLGGMKARLRVDLLDV